MSQQTCQLQSLQNLCIGFVARNLSKVDSLVGFPSIVGRKIWNEFMKIQGVEGKGKTKEAAGKVTAKAINKTTQKKEERSIAGKNPKTKTTPRLLSDASVATAGAEGKVIAATGRIAAVAGKVTQDEMPAILAVFADAYETEFLESLRLRDNLLMINEHEESLLPLIRFATKIDLQGCLLGDTHDLLRAIGKECNRLEILNLTRNQLTNRGLRTLFGMDQESGCPVRTLVLADNPGINAKGLQRYALNSEHLKAVTISVSKNSLAETVDAMKANRFYSAAAEARAAAFYEPFENSGWAAPLLKNWEMAAKQRTEDIRKARAAAAAATILKTFKTGRAAIDFYGGGERRKLVQQENATAFNVRKNDRSTQTTVTFKRTIASDVTKCETLPMTSSSPPKKRRKLQLSDEDDCEFDALKQLYAS